MPPRAMRRQVRAGMLTPRRLAIRRAVSYVVPPVAVSAEHVLVLHQRFLTETARYVQHVELWRVGESCIRHELEPMRVSHWRCRLGEDAVTGIRKAREDLERTREVHLIEFVKCERADLQVLVRRIMCDLSQKAVHGKCLNRPQVHRGRLSCQARPKLCGQGAACPI